jgi:hypothetical protein
MKGNPKAQYPSQQQDYVKVVSGGKTLGRNGLEIKPGQDGFKKPSHHPDSHIPLFEWKQWKAWDKI